MATFSDLTSAANAAHIHVAPPGADGGIVFPLDFVPPATSGIIPEQDFAINAEQLDDLKAGLHYFNVHTTNFGGGEIRGQINAVPMLTVAKGGSGTSSNLVTSSPAGITCGGDCAEAYNAGTSVTLTAGAAATGSFFAGWIGGGCAGTGTCVVTLTGNTTVTAVYSLSTTTLLFSDDPLSQGLTLVKAAHVVELQNAVATLRANNQLGVFPFTDAPLTAGATVKALHITELRTAINAVFTQRGRGVITYTDQAITATETLIKGVHVSELRLAVRLIE
jgi:CHRD domain-containing protein